MDGKVIHLQGNLCFHITLNFPYLGIGAMFEIDIAYIKDYQPIHLTNRWHSRKTKNKVHECCLSKHMHGFLATKCAHMH